VLQADYSCSLKLATPVAFKSSMYFAGQCGVLVKGADVLERLARLLRAGHSYSVPQITMRTERCMADYAQWLRSQVSTRDVADTADMAAAPRITAA